MKRLVGGDLEREVLQTDVHAGFQITLQVLLDQLRVVASGHHAKADERRQLRTALQFDGGYECIVERQAEEVEQTLRQRQKDEHSTDVEQVGECGAVLFERIQIIVAAIGLRSGECEPVDIVDDERVENGAVNQMLGIRAQMQ